MLSGSIWANITQGNYFFNVGPWLTDNFYEENLFGSASSDTNEIESKISCFKVLPPEKGYN